MKLALVLSQPKGWWLQALDQEKIPYAPLKLSSLGSPADRYDVGVLSSAPTPHTLRYWREHLESGGTLVTTKEFYALIGKDYGDRVFLVKDPQQGEKNQGSFIGKKFMIDERHFAIEQAATFPMGEWRRSFLSALKAAFWKKNLPLARLGRYPYPYESVFCFRLDFDNFDSQDLETTLKLIERQPNAVSCFINLKSFERHGDYIARLARLGVEIGSHAYVHHVYDRHAQNRWNVAKADNILKNWGHRCQGFTAPHGVWNQTLQSTLEQSDYVYSSEFTLDYDNLPFYPVVMNKRSSVLQVPAHPVCEGVIMEAHGFNEELIRDYFSRVIASRLLSFEPVIIFGHPDGRLGRYPQIFENIMSEVNRYERCWKTQMRSWAAWWTERQTWSFDIDWSEELRLLSGPQDPRAVLELFFAGDRVSRLSFADLAGHKIPVARLAAESQPVRAGDWVPSESADGVPLFKYCKRSIKKWLDWETKTPTEDYVINGFKDRLRTAARAAHDRFAEKKTHA